MTRLRLRTLSALFLILTYTAVAQTGPALPAGIQKVTAVEGITEYRLPNGLKVLLFPDPSKETITVNLTYMVGSRHEGYGETGMAHLLEHLVFKGTPRHTNIPKELTDHGARPNGTTSLDRTNYFETFSATDANLEWALDLESDRMVNSFIAKKDLDSEMTVVRNEFEMGENNPSRVLMQKVLAAAYQWHNYGKSTIGARSDIENVPIERLQAFYRKYYQPDNSMLVVAGKIDEAKTLALIAKLFGPLPRPARTIYPTYTAEPVQDGERSLTLRRVGDTQLILAAYHVPAGSHPDFTAATVLARTLGNSPSGRLYKALVEPKKAVNASAFAWQLREPGVLMFMVALRKEQSIEEARTILLKTIDEAASTPLPADEVDRVKKQFASSFEQILQNPEMFALNLSEWESKGDWRLFFLERDRTRKVTVEDVNRVAGLYLRPSNRTIGVFIPDEKPVRAEIPPAPEVSTLLKDYRGQTAMAQGEAFDPSPANIDARTRRGQIGDGIKLVFLEKKTRNSVVNATLSLHYGDEKTLKNRGAAPGILSGILMRGTTKMTRQQIQDELTRLKAQLGVMGAGFSLQTTRENLPAVLRLAAEILQSPAFPEKEFEELKLQQLAGLESQKSEPAALAQEALFRHLYPYPKDDVRYMKTIDERIAEVKAVTLDDVKKYYTDFFGASHGELSVVGDFDAEQVQQLAKSLFGDWKSQSSYARVPRLYHQVQPIAKWIETPDKANAVFYGSVPLRMDDRHPDYPALLFGNYLLGGGFLNSRFAVRIRQKDGLSYGVSSMFSAGSEDQVGTFTMYAICAPQNVEKVEKAFKEELARAQKEGFTAEEVEAAKQGWAQSRRVSRAQDGTLAGTLRGHAYLNRTMAYDADLEKKVLALTPAQIQEAVRKHLPVEAVSVVRAGDFAKAKAAAGGGQ